MPELEVLAPRKQFYNRLREPVSAASWLTTNKLATPTARFETYMLGGHALAVWSRFSGIDHAPPGAPAVLLWEVGVDGYVPPPAKDGAPEPEDPHKAFNGQHHVFQFQFQLLEKHSDIAAEIVKAGGTLEV